MKPYLYIAAPLFSFAEQEFNRKLKQPLEPYFDIYLPQEDGGLMVDMIKNGMDIDIAEEKIYEKNIDAIEMCTHFLAVLDGRTIDEGVAFELGYASALAKKCYGLQTDVRRLLPSGNNPMIDHPLTRIFKSVEEVVEWAEKSN